MNSITPISTAPTLVAHDGTCLPSPWIGRGPQPPTCPCEPAPTPVPVTPPTGTTPPGGGVLDGDGTWIPFPPHGPGRAG